MKKILHFSFQQSFSRSPRLIFQNVDQAPRANDNFKGPEKQSEAQAVAEVASKSPSDIFNDTVSAGSSMQQQYTQGTVTVAKVVTTDPLFIGDWSSAAAIAASHNSTLPANDNGLPSSASTPAKAA